MSEEISQLVDGEMDKEQTQFLLESISIGKQSAKSWGTYHLIGNVMCGEVSVTGQNQALSIAEALENESAVLSPSMLSNVYPVSGSGKRSSAGIGSLSGGKGGHIDGAGKISGNDYWRPVGMLAVAASIALVAVITLNPSQKSSFDSSELDPSESVAHNTGITSDTQIVSSTMEQQKFAQEFDEMLSEHGEFAAASGLNGLVAYAKLVSNQRLEQ